MHIDPVSDKHQLKVVEVLAYMIWHDHYTPIIGKDQVDYMLEKFQSVQAMSDQIEDGYSYFLCTDHHKHVGYMSVNIRENELFLSKFYVLLSERGKGYGKNMIKFLEALAKEKSLNKISLTVNKHNSDSINIYKKLGFLKCGTVIQDIGNGFVMDDCILEKRL